MRVISGQFGGRVFSAPNSKLIHPMSEKVRGAIFSALGDISGLRVLDLYSGSGALAIESISRGAESVTAVDADPKAVKTISANLKLFNINKTQINLVSYKVETWLKLTEQKFDLILADPPYLVLPSEAVLNSLATHLNPTGMLVLSWPGREKLPQISRTTLVKNKSFNDAQVGYYRVAI